MKSSTSSISKTTSSRANRTPIFTNINGRKNKLTDSPPRIIRNKSKMAISNYDSSIPDISIPNSSNTGKANTMVTIISSTQKLPPKMTIDKIDWSNLAHLAIIEDNDDILSFAISHYSSTNDIDWISLIEQAILNSSRYSLEYLLKRVNDLDLSLDWRHIGNIAQKYGEETGDTRVLKYLLSKGYLRDRL